MEYVRNITNRKEGLAIIMATIWGYIYGMFF